MKTDLFNGAPAPSAKTLHHFATFPRMTREDWFWLFAAATTLSGIAVDAKTARERFAQPTTKPSAVKCWTCDSTTTNASRVCDDCAQQKRTGFALGDVFHRSRKNFT